MSHNILITGVSGYLGGTLLARLSSADLPPFQKVYAAVRTDEQAAQVRAQNDGTKGLLVEPLQFDLYDAAAVREHVVGRAISVVFHLIDALNGTSQVAFIKALAEVKDKTGQEVHFLHVSGPARRTECVGRGTPPLRSLKIMRCRGYMNSLTTVPQTDLGSQDVLIPRGSAD